MKWYDVVCYAIVCYILCYVKVWLYEMVMWYGMVCYILCYVKVWLYEVVCGMVCYAIYFAM